MSITTHMNKGFSSYSHPTYDDVKTACKHIAEFIHYNTTGIGKVQTIVGITRGGLIPAVELSNMLGIPMTTVEYSSQVGKGDNKNHENLLPEISSKKILLVDDLVDSGYTMKEISDHYTEQGHEVYTAVIHYKERDNNVHEPDVWAVKISENFGWIYYPWEEGLDKHT